MLKVENLKNKRGYTAPNQFVLTIGETKWFQSYSSIIARVEPNGVLTLGLHWDYSKTTSRWLRVFLEQYCHKYSNLTKAQLQKLIDSNEIKYVAEKNFFE